MESKTIKTTVVFPITVWMIINITLMVILLLNGDTADFNNWLEIALWSISIVGLVTKRKWGSAFAIFTLCYTFSTSLGNVMYFGIWINAIRVAINAPLITLLFHWIFQGKFK